ncbi:MAG: glycosyltransferase, partial [Anaerolineae bacterium]
MMAGNKKLHIVHISPNLGAGGAEFLVVGLCEHFVNLGFETTVITLFPPGGIDVSIALAQKRRLLDAGVRVIHLDKHLGSDPSMIPKLHRLLRDLKPHVVHTHRYVLRYTLLPMLLCRIPVRVHTVHNIAQKEVDRIGKLVHRFAFRFGGVVPVSISQEVANSVKAIYGRDIKSPVIYNGIPVQSFAEALKHQRENSENLVLLHIGRFAPQKNYRLLIEVFSLAVKEYPKMYLWLVGDGPLRSQIEELVFRR